MKRPLRIATVLTVYAASAFSQLPLSQVSERGVDLFEIGRSSSFAASSRSQTSDEPARSTSQRETKRILSDLAEAVSVIQKNHVGGRNIDLNAITKSAIGGALQALDPHSSYFDSTEYGEFLSEEQSEYSGIGATIAGYRNNGQYDTYVTSVIAGSPASTAKLAFGDRIIKVDGQSFDGRSSDDVRDAVRGKPGTPVNLVIERASTGKVESVTLKRRMVQQPSIRDYFMLNNSVGYIAMTEGFNYTTANEMTAALRQLHRLGAKSLILDLRENPGGILEQAVRIAEKFLPAGSTIVTQRGRSRLDNRVWTSANRNPETLPLVLLVNENSASASEILAGALQDHDRALIVGERTFGKGLVQSLYDGPLGTGLTLTTARYYTPSGRCIQRDYSEAGLYDYYNHRIPETLLKRTEARTSSNRAVFGGDGIEPDISVSSRQLSQAESELDDVVFLFTRDLVNGRVGQLRAPVVKSRSVDRGSTIAGPELFDEFQKYAQNVPSIKSTLTDLSSKHDFIFDRINYYLTLAKRGDVLANRSNIKQDLPVVRAMAELPKAQSLALAGRTAKN
jgi:carboxyl-terminal processing protease